MRDGNAIEAVQARDFLDEIDFAGEIVAEGGRLPGGFVVVMGGDTLTQPRCVRFRSIVSNGMSTPSRLSIRLQAQRDRAARRGRRAGDGRCGGDGRAGQFDEQRQGAVARGEQRAGIDAAFVAVGGIGDEAEAAAGAAHGGGQEPGGLEHDFRGRVGDAGGLAAHHARDGDGAAFVGDDEIVRQQRVGLVVERLELFARARRGGPR